MRTTVVEDGNPVGLEGRVLETDEGQQVAPLEHLDKLKRRSQVAMLLEPKRLSGEDLKAFAGGQGDAAVVPVEGETVDDLRGLGVMVDLGGLQHSYIF